MDTTVDLELRRQTQEADTSLPEDPQEDPQEDPPEDPQEEA
jgi:hypothetical protein